MIKLLELPTLQLEQRVKQEIEENPVLEEEQQTAEESTEDNGMPKEVSMEEYLKEAETPAYKSYVNNYSRDDKARQVVGVEVNRDAVRDAIGNAKHNGVKNARFFAADATAWIREAADAGQKADVVFMDPPREGSTPAFIESVARMAPKRIVYVSCNPETMARDLALLTQKGYRAEGFTPVDMFPHSAHCEVVGSLVRVKYSSLRF